jgi:hypothetical protein
MAFITNTLSRQQAALACMLQALIHPATLAAHAFCVAAQLLASQMKKANMSENPLKQYSTYSSEPACP